MADLVTFLATVPPFAALDDAERAAIAERCVERTLSAGSRLLSQGDRNRALYVLRSGHLVVRARQGDRVETIAELQSPAVVGEISFITGRTCSADVEVVAEARVVELQRDALASQPRAYDRIVHGLADIVAGRLYNIVTGDSAPASAPVVRISRSDRWAAPRAFAQELTRGLARESASDALLVRVVHEPSAATSIEVLEHGVASATLSINRVDGQSDDVAARRVREWRERFAAVVLMPESPTLDAVGAFSTHQCVLLGDGDPVPPPDAAVLVAQDARFPTLPSLDGTRQLVPDVADAEAALGQGRSGSARFRARVESLARAVLGQQVGIALGAGGARGWCHVGLLDVFSQGGLPIDVVAGTSIGAVVGGLWASGASAEDLAAAAAEWRRRRLAEWRIWRMHLASERRLDALFAHYFGDRRVNEATLPFWANAVDIERGEEVVLRDGLLRRVARASMAFPGWAPPVSIDGRLLVDGAVLAPAPAQIVRSMGAGFVATALAIGPFSAKPLTPRLPMRVYDTLARTLHLSGVAMGRAGSDVASDVVVVPDLGDATMLSFDRDRELIAAGRRAAEIQLPAILTAYERFKRARRRTAV